ncbi:cysteine hydrolase family protein [Microvirga massiliensis]|uniref:cysteine hydrolase family protein n=1 Tax=Microvirga massiliensis TaxID=1033741 RepID=UPI00062BF1F4|nr:cysteine hydrolase [Microvirga massiliensis]
MVVDLQPAFSHPGSAWYTPAVAQAAQRIAALVPLFGERVVFTRFVPPARPEGSWSRYYDKWSFACDPTADWLWEVDDPWKGRLSVASHTFSKWAAARHLFGPEVNVVLCGVSTDCCVLATALAAIDEGAHVRVVADACAAKSPRIHEDSLSLMALRAPLITIVDSDEEKRRHCQSEQGTS